MFGMYFTGISGKEKKMASENGQERRETLTDIVADLRGRADCAERHGDRETHNDGVATLLRSIADRIEAIDSADAWRSLYTPSNAATMRAAAATMYNVLEKLKTFSLHIGDIGHKREFNHLVCLAKNRLTPLSPRRRASATWARKCCYESPSGRLCPLYKKGVDCRFIWAQTPYAEKGDGDGQE